MNPTPYRPKGKIIPLLQAMAREPDRVWSIPEAARVMSTSTKSVMATCGYALKAGIMYRTVRLGMVVLSSRPFDPCTMKEPSARTLTLPASNWMTRDDDPRIPRVVPGWTPPKMVCVREAA
jgi:hypothetical protein